jgi:hypothetical protein
MLYKSILNSVVAIAAIACFGLGCAGTLPPPKYFEDMERRAGEGESEIVVKRISSLIGGAIKQHVFIDGEVRLKLSDGETGTVVVPNGRHSINVNFGGLRSEMLTVDVESNRTIFFSEVIAGLFINKLEIKKYMEIPWYNSNTPPSASYETAPDPNAEGIEEAIKKACSKLINKLPSGSKIAVVNIAAEEKSIASLVIDEVEFNLVSANRFTIVDRNALDLIRTEQKLQMSGEVSDNDVVRIGQLSGANVVIAGSVIKTDDSNRNRLSLKALDVKTGQIIEMARGPYNIMAGGQTARAHEPASTSAVSSVPKQTLGPSAQPTQYKQYTTYTNFTGTERFGTWAINWLLPGVGSAAIMKDWGGATTQWVLFGGGILCMVNGFSTYEEPYYSYSYSYPYGYTETIAGYNTYTEPNALFNVGFGMLVSNFTFNIIRSITYKKKMPKNMALLENSDLNVVVLPDKDGNIKGYMLYSMGF